MVHTDTIDDHSSQVRVIMRVCTCATYRPQVGMLGTPAAQMTRTSAISHEAQRMTDITKFD